MNKLKGVILIALCLIQQGIFAENLIDYKEYCQSHGGEVQLMPAQLNTSSGVIEGQSHYFCNFSVDHGFISIGLETFASDKPSIAATYIKKMGKISHHSQLWKGSTYGNPSHNFCRNIGGTTIGVVTSGGFANELGQSDICVFGDGSMVSGWSLIYMANQREGYGKIKEQVKAQPLKIYIPK